MAQIRLLLTSFPWLSSAFRDLLEGKNHLPNNKLRVNLLNQTDGFLGDGIYRAHFFGDHTLADLAVKAAGEQARYSVPALNWQRRSHAHLATQTAGFEKPGGYTKLIFEPGTKWFYSDGGPNWLAELPPGPNSNRGSRSAGCCSR